MLDRANTRRRRAQRPSGKTRRSVAQVPVCIEEEVQRRTAELRAALDLEHRRLREMGHRVKNNLQTLSALTLLKARRT
jgi:two-component sensor histidine kinase